MYTIELSHYKDFEGFTHTETFEAIEEITTAERWYNDFVNNGNTLDGFNGEIAVMDMGGKIMSTFWVNNA